MLSLNLRKYFASELKRTAMEKLNSLNIVVKGIEETNGLSNATFKITTDDKPLIFKIYKDTFGQLVNRQSETSVILQLQKHQKHPKIIYYDGKCRVQQFIQGTPLTDKRLTAKQLHKIVKEISILKQIDVQIPQRTFEDVVKLGRLLYQQVKQIKKVKTHDLIQAMLGNQMEHKIKNILPNKMVLSHNDLNLTNCIQNHDGHISVIDYEFTSKNYLGFDIGNLFNQVTTEYSQKFEIHKQWQIQTSIKQQLMSEYFGSLDKSEQWRLVRVGRILSHHFWFIIGMLSFKDQSCHLDLNYYLKRRWQEIHYHLRQI